MSTGSHACTVCQAACVLPLGLRSDEVQCVQPTAVVGNPLHMHADAHNYSPRHRTAWDLTAADQQQTMLCSLLQGDVCALDLPRS